MNGSSVSTALLSLVSAIIGGLIVGGFSYLGTTRQMDVKMVEIAVGILSQEPKDNIAPARKWAVDVISHYAEVKPSEDVKQALIENRAVMATWGADAWGSDLLSKSLQERSDELHKIIQSSPDRPPAPATTP